MGERPELIVEGCRRAVEMGVYPFVVPLRPVPGTLMADAAAPDPDYVGRIYAEVSAMIADAGLDHLDAKAGCARCQACSGLSAWERVLRRGRSDGAPRRLAAASALACRLVETAGELAAHHAVRRRVFVDRPAAVRG